jgi:hypothetical protein
MLPSSGGAISARTSSTAVLRGFSQSAHGRAATAEVICGMENDYPDGCEKCL